MSPSQFLVASLVRVGVKAGPSDEPLRFAPLDFPQRVGRPYRPQPLSLMNLESFLGLDKIRIRINSRMIAFPRQ
jgi:hypothetical protein